MIEFERNETLVPPQFHRLLGSKTGLVNDLYYNTPARGDPRAYQSSLSRCDVEYLVDAGGADVDLGASGKGASLSDSFTACLGEAIERWALGWPDADEFVHASHRELSATEDVVDFEYLDVLEDGLQRRLLTEFTRDTELYWTAGVDLLSGEQVYIPAQHIYYNVGPLRDEPAYLFGTSNGTAAGPTLIDAVYRAVVENVERDGIMRTWCRQRVPPRVDVDAVPEVSEFVDRALPHGDFSVELLSLDAAVDVPVFGSALVRHSDEYPKFAMAGAAGVDAYDALHDAAVEAMQGWPYLHAIATQHDVDAYDIGDVTTDFERNMLYYALPEHYDEVEFLLEGESTVPDFDRYPDAGDWSTARRLSHLLERFEAADCTPIVFDVTTPDCRAAGVRVARAFVPELVGISTPAALPTRHPAFDGVSVTRKPHPYP